MTTMPAKTIVKDSVMTSSSLPIAIKSVTVGLKWAAEASPAQEAVPQEAAREAMVKGNHCAFATRTAR